MGQGVMSVSMPEKAYYVTDLQWCSPYSSYSKLLFHHLNKNHWLHEMINNFRVNLLTPHYLKRQEVLTISTAFLSLLWSWDCMYKCITDLIHVNTRLCRPASVGFFIEDAMWGSTEPLIHSGLPISILGLVRWRTLSRLISYSSL